MKKTYSRFAVRCSDTPLICPHGQVINLCYKKTLRVGDCYYSKADGYTSCSCPLLSSVVTKVDRISLAAFGGSLKDEKKAGPTPGEILAPWMGVYSIQDSVASLQHIEV